MVAARVPRRLLIQQLFDSQERQRVRLGDARQRAARVVLEPCSGHYIVVGDQPQQCWKDVVLTAAAVTSRAASANRPADSCSACIHSKVIRPLVLGRLPPTMQISDYVLVPTAETLLTALLRRISFGSRQLPQLLLLLRLL